MKELIRNLFPVKQAGAMNYLWEDDPALRLSVAKSVGTKLLSKEAIYSDAPSQVMALMSLASFANSDQECIHVAGAINKLVTSRDPLPLVSVHRGYALASRCLISLGMFYKGIEHRHKYHGAPNPSFYRKIGKQTFDTIGQKGIAGNFEKWETFLQEIFI
ncbi:hypothetical protein HN832_02040 [archaeon]|jgi:hypothetical protein|nr:hypothetical protein [archaeon]MBT4373134.1 hypothetical protein [archaeon]MBT4531479.1 hypothetical protein [archaeon]MBT7001343.1 hypothetical protein [archaeon]MBT7282171.1 hypothetical protein [archaeon]